MCFLPYSILGHSTKALFPSHRYSQFGRLSSNLREGNENQRERVYVSPNEQPSRAILKSKSATRDLTLKSSDYFLHLTPSYKSIRQSEREESLLISSISHTLPFSLQNFVHVLGARRTTMIHVEAKNL